MFTYNKTKYFHFQSDFNVLTHCEYQRQQYYTNYWISIFNLLEQYGYSRLNSDIFYN